MNDIDLQSSLALAKNLWEKARPEELAILKGLLRDIEYDYAKRIMESARMSANVSLLPLKTIKEKIDATRIARNVDGCVSLRWTMCYIVCAEYDANNVWMYKGRIMNISFPSRLSPDEIKRGLTLHVERDLTPLYGMGRYEFFIGSENTAMAQGRANELKQQAYVNKELPSRFYKKQEIA